MKQLTKALILVLCLVLLAGFAVSCGNDPADSTTPEDTTPEVTTPEDTTPEDTTPEDTTPEDTTPEETLPDETLPPETLPEETTPVEPDETEPEETKPAETEPEETEPADTTHTHVYNASRSAATCTTDGYTTYSCACGEMYIEEGDKATGHYWRLTQVVPSTCIVAGDDIYVCDICDEIDERPLPLAAHSYTISTAIVTPEEDPRGEGYEILGCDMCTLMAKVAANSASGHNFVVGSDGVAKCGCGTIGIPVEENVVTLDFEEGTEASIGGLGTSPVEDGKWRASDMANNQPSIHKNNAANIAELTQGVCGDMKIANFEMSFELSFTGKLPSNSGAFVSWRTVPPGKSYQEELNITLSPNGDKVQISSNNGKADLAANKTYVVTISVSPSSNGMVATVEGEDLDAVTLFDGISKAPVNQFLGIWFRCNAIRQDKSVFALYIDNLSFTAYAQLADEGTMVSEPCEHVFTSESVVDDAHPAAELWYKDTCSECGRYYYRQDCTAIGGHILAEELADYKPNTCVEEGYEKYLCLVCGDTITKVLEKEHIYNVFSGIVSAADDPHGKGYEFLKCQSCSLLAKVEANDESGHCFGEDGNCACGAYKGDFIQSVATHDFSSTQGSFNIAGVTDAHIVDGWLDMAANNHYRWVNASSNAAFAEALCGEYDGETFSMLELSFDFKYTGDFTSEKASQDYFIMMGSKEDGGIHYILSLLPNGDGRVKFQRTNTVVLERDTVYKVTIVFNLETNQVKLFVEGDDLAKFEVYSTTKYDLSDFNWFRFGSHSNRFYSATGEWHLYADNFVLGYPKNGIDEGGMAEAECVHNFVDAPVVDDEHPADELWFTETCSECGCYYYRQDCSFTGGHVWTDDPVGGTLGTCQVSGDAIYECRICGEQEHRITEAGKHVYNVLLERVPAEGDVQGHETWRCQWCELTETIDGDHADGHYFGETGVCVCGATYGMMTHVVGSLDFNNYTVDGSNIVGDGFSIAGGSGAIVNGAWRISSIGANGYIDQRAGATNAAFYDIVDGVYDETGAEFDEVEFSFDTYYTGTMPTTISGSVFSLRDEDLGYPASCLVEINLGNSSGKLTISGKNGSATLEAGVHYRVTITMNVNTNAVSIVLTGDGIEPVSLANYTAAGSIAAFDRIFLTRSAHKIDEAAGAIFWDNVVVGYRAIGVGTANMVNPEVAE